MGAAWYSRTRRLGALRPLQLGPKLLLGRVDTPALQKRRGERHPDLRVRRVELEHQLELEVGLLGASR